MYKDRASLLTALRWLCAINDSSYHISVVERQNMHAWVAFSALAIAPHSSTTHSPHGRSAAADVAAQQSANHTKACRSPFPTARVASIYGDDALQESAIDMHAADVAVCLV